MAKPSFIELSRTERIPILYEDRAVRAEGLTSNLFRAIILP